MDYLFDPLIGRQAFKKLGIKVFDHAIKGFEMMKLRVLIPDRDKNDFR